MFIFIIKIKDYLLINLKKVPTNSNSKEKKKSDLHKSNNIFEEKRPIKEIKIF
jgi:hypothetical protein